MKHKPDEEKIAGNDGQDDVTESLLKFQVCVPIANSIQDIVLRLENNEQDTSSMRQLAHYLSSHGQWEAALKILRIAENIAPEDLNILNDLALLCDQLDLEEEAQAYYELILRKVPNHIASLCDYGTFLVKTKNFVMAKSFFLQALASSPREAQDYIRIGQLATKLGQKEDAFRCYQIAYDLSPQDVRVLEAIGDSYLRYREFVEAWSLFQQAAQLEPENEHVKQQLRDLTQFVKIH